MIHIKPSLAIKLIGSVLATALLATPVYSDDTDIFTGIESEGADTFLPNILFLFDTSGSMQTGVIPSGYDPSKDYGNSNPDYIYVYTSNLTTHTRTVHASNSYCRNIANHIFAPERAADPSWYGRSYCERTDRTRSRWYVSANYHDFLQSDETPTPLPRIDVMQQAAINLINGLTDPESDENIPLNIGLMRFNGSSGGYVIQDFADISDDDNKSGLITAIDGLTATGSTPLTETLWEAGLYYRGQAPRYGNLSAADSSAFTSGLGSNYKSPIINSCQKNHIVLLTDGAPTGDDGANGLIHNVTGDSSCTFTSGGERADQTCLDELSQYLFTEDQVPDGDGFDGPQTISTYTIGFAKDMDLLQQTAINGGGKYYTAGDAVELKAAFTNIIADIIDTNTTFTAPAVTVNAYNNLQHKNELYYAIFKPKSRTSWPGNIKRYQIEPDGTVTDVKGFDAINPNTGFFASGAHSWWSKDVDGDEVDAGGFSEQLQSTSVTLTYTSTDAPAGAALNTAAHTLNTDNSNITNALMGLPESTTADVREKLINWAQGIDVDDISDDDTHNFVADPLHTRPVVVTYGGTNTAPDDVVFGMTNLGMLHAIDTDDGSEIFRFIPQALLPNINAYYEDASGTNKVYGLDGPITVLREESDDDDVKIEAADGDKVYLYFGMRRGGNNYYAMDVTDRSNPKLLWRIEGGSGDFANLGQTWSSPELAYINWNCDSNGENCTTKAVLFFGGGYDVAHDTATAPTSGDKGSAIYMVDAETGDLLWSASNLGGNLALPIQNSIPSDVVLGDISGDGRADILFATDIMGHVWRIDFNEETTNASNFATGGMVANLQGASGSELRRFYHSPAIAAISPPGENSYFIIGVGSGYRASPKEEVINDRFYTLFSDSVFGAPKDDRGNTKYVAISASSLFNATNAVADKATNATHGFYIQLDGQGEKVLSSPLIFSGTIFFTTYLTSGKKNQCGVNIGSGRLWAIDTATGAGKINGARNVDLNHGGIASSPVLVLVGDGNGGSSPVLCVGTECFTNEDLGGKDCEGPLANCQRKEKTYWLEK